MLLLLSLLSCGGSPPESAVLALTPTEYNNSVRDLLGMPDEGSDWPAAPEIAGRFTAFEGETRYVFGGTIRSSPWPWVFPPETGVDGFEGMFEGQEPSAYETEELQKAAVHFASYALASDVFFTCDDWGEAPTESCGLDSVVRFAQRAWRRPIEADERERLEAFWQANWSAGTPEEAVVLTVAGLLQSPQFLYRVERGDRARVREGRVPLTDFELASRLSYFLWDSMPDIPLFHAATNGELSTDEGLRAQVQRMLDDPRAHDAVVRFHAQLLGVDRVHSASPARSAYGPAFGLSPSPALDTTDDDEWPSVLGPLRHSMEGEFTLFVRDGVFGDEGTLTGLLSSTQGWASTQTSPLYGDTQPREGEPESWVADYIAASGPVTERLILEPVTFPAGERAGLLTLPAVLAVNAYAVHPAPVMRGVTVLERLVCVELGSPPPGAEAAAPPDVAEAESTNRERTELATSPSECSACHDSINPAGFAFEHYDALGAYRATDNEEPVDASGSFTVSGETFSFTDALTLGQALSESDQVRDCYSLRWARVATGEELDPDDERLEEIQAGFREQDNIRALLEQIVMSELFRNLWDGEGSP